jgi:hypothetical protein
VGKQVPAYVRGHGPLETPAHVILWLGAKPSRAERRRANGTTGV